MEFDPEAMAVNARYKTGKVARMVERPARAMHLPIDLDAKREVLASEGIEMEEPAPYEPEPSN